MHAWRQRGQFDHLDFWVCARAPASTLRAQAGCARTGSRVAGCQHIVQVCVGPNPNWFMF